MMPPPPEKLNYNVLDIEDCCSANSQIALASGDIDVAVLCPDAAEGLVTQDSRFTIIGPVLQNSDVLLVNDVAKVKTVGISQNHLYQKDIVARLLGTGCQVSQVSAEGLAMAYVSGTVDGVVLDVPQALTLTGTMMAVGGTTGNVITYELVVRKDLSALNQVIQDFTSAAAELADTATLQKAINQNNIYQVTGEEASQWTQMNVRILAPK